MSRLKCPPDPRMEPLCGPVPTVPRRPRPKLAKPRAWGHCPLCVSAPRHALVLQGIHLVWRPHDIVTMSGAKLPCGASGIRLCDAHPRPGTSVVDVGKERHVRTRCTCLAVL